MQSLWMIASALLFSGMAVCVKFASAWFNNSELVLARGLLGMVFMWLLARRQKVPLATAYPLMHAWRSLVGVMSLGGWFYAIAGLPLATAMTLNYMSSLWVAAFLVGGSLLGLHAGMAGYSPLRQGALVVTVGAGFAGVLMMLHPSIAQDQALAAVVGLLSGFAAAFAYMQVMALGRIGEAETRTVFYFCAASAVAGALGMLVEGVTRWDWHAVWLLPIGLLAAFGQLCLTRAYSQGATLVVASLQYLGIVFGGLFGMALFGDRLGVTGWAGMALIVASGVAATVLRTRAAPDAPAEEL